MNSSIISQSHCSGSSRGTGPSESVVIVKDQIYIYGGGMGQTEEVVEQFATVLVGMKPVVDVRLKSGVYVAVI